MEPPSSTKGHRNASGGYKVNSYEEEFEAFDALSPSLRYLLNYAHDCYSAHEILWHLRHGMSPRDVAGLLIPSGVEFEATKPKEKKHGQRNR